MQVPQVENFTDETQLHGGIILELKQRHPCKDHPGEQNAPGYCYKPVGCGLDAHVRLNNRRFKKWSAAIVRDQSILCFPCLPRSTLGSRLREKQPSSFRQTQRTLIPVHPALVDAPVRTHLVPLRHLLRRTPPQRQSPMHHRLCLWHSSLFSAHLRDSSSLL